MSSPQEENQYLKEQITHLTVDISNKKQGFSDSELMLKFLKNEELTIAQAMAELDVKDKAYLSYIYQLSERVRRDVITSDEYFLTGKLP